MAMPLVSSSVESFKREVGIGQDEEPYDAFTMTTTDSWTGGLPVGTFDWAEMSIEDAIYWFERGNIMPDGVGANWYVNLNDWSEACTANDAVEDGVNTGWSEVGYDGLNVNYLTQTSMRGVLCAGTPDSLNMISEDTKVNISKELNIVLPTAADPVGAYVAYKIVNNLQKPFIL